MSNFNINHFWKFCSALQVDTKENGLQTLSPELLMGTQKYFIEEIARGLEEGIHSFVVLKGRQLGITTICLALDLYWMFKNQGLSGAMVTHDEKTREMFRATLTMYMDGLPDKWKIPSEIHNRSQLVLKNRSRFDYQVAGTRKNTKLGKGTALTFVHATEVSEYGDEEGIASLEAAMAEHNPNRLYIYESTAQGYNHYFDMWENAQNARSQRAIFIGWWRNQFYVKKKGSPEYEVYWDGKLSPEEKKWVREIEQKYGHKVNDEQMAWWRWNMNEKTKDETLMYQNFPPTEDYAFIKSGTNFFNTQRINDEYKIALRDKPKTFRFILRESFEETELTQCGEKMANLKIWEHPVAGGYYSVGADPAYGSSDWADRFAIAVYRCYADQAEMVAEFNTTDCSTYQFAWVLAYLAGVYGPGTQAQCMINLEINGPGQAVWTELVNMRRLASSMRGSSHQIMFKLLSEMQNYLYKRVDSFGAPSGFHTITTQKEKERMFNLFKDGFERGIIKVRSSECVNEMTNIQREDGYLGAPGRGKDDRIVASSLATIAWVDYIRIRLAQIGHTKAFVTEKEKNGEPKIGNQLVSNYLKAIGISNAG